MHITMPDTTKPVSDLLTALMLLDNSVADSGIDADTSHLWSDFETHNHEIILYTNFLPTERGKEWKYQVTEEIARMLVDAGFVEDHSLNEDGTMYAISPDGTREHTRLAKQV